MKDNIYAKVIAQPTSFPQEIQVRYIPVDHLDEPTEEYFYGFGPETWAQVKNRYSIDDDYAETCEGIFLAGRAATIAPAQRWDGKWPEPGDPDFGAMLTPYSQRRAQYSLCGMRKPPLFDVNTSVRLRDPAE